MADLNFYLKKIREQKIAAEAATETSTIYFQVPIEQEQEVLQKLAAMRDELVRDKNLPVVPAGAAKAAQQLPSGVEQEKEGVDENSSGND